MFEFSIFKTFLISFHEKSHKQKKRKSSSSNCFKKKCREFHEEKEKQKETATHQKEANLIQRKKNKEIKNVALQLRRKECIKKKRKNKKSQQRKQKKEKKIESLQKSRKKQMRIVIQPKNNEDFYFVNHFI